MKTYIRALLAMVLLVPAVSQAWCNDDWKQRTDILLNTTSAGVQTPQTIAGMTVRVRLLSGTPQSGAIKAGAAVALEANGLIGQSAHPNTTPIVWPANDKLKIAAGGSFSVAMWVKPEAAAGTVFSQGPVKIALANGALSAQVGGT